jgi:hypothetical protein
MSKKMRKEIEKNREYDESGGEAKETNFGLFIPKFT